MNPIEGPIFGEILPIYIGWDKRQTDAWNVCSFSIRRRTSKPTYIHPVSQPSLRWMGIYSRAPESDTHIDSEDGLPFSTDFAFTRFLVPALSHWRGWALFVDCDFLFLSDVADLFARADDRYAVMCVKHNHRPQEKTKMHGVEQSKYPRKNWSSLVLWNCGHPSNRKLTISDVNQRPGRWLHGFEWLEDSEIGELPERWNWLEGWSHQGADLPSAIHFTRGGPWHEDWQDVAYADLWTQEREIMDHWSPSKINAIGRNITDPARFVGADPST